MSANQPTISITSSFTLDHHTWIVNNNTIMDFEPHFKEFYDMVAQIRLGTTNYEFVYCEWQKSSIPKNILKNLNYNFKEFEGQMSNIVAEHGTNILQICLRRVQNQIGMCSHRAYILRKQLIKEGKKPKLIVGSMGLKCKKTGKVWWEHGNGSPDFNNRPQHTC
jgi:hypothetical protein